MNFYDSMKAKCQKDFNEQNAFFDLFNIMLSRFEWEGLPDNIPAAFLEGLFLTNGIVCFGKNTLPTQDRETLWATPGSYYGDIVGYLPKNCKGVLPEVEVDGVALGEDATVVVGWNNLALTPERDIYKYSSLFAELDVSEKVNIIFSRLLRIPKVSSQKEKTAVETAIQSIVDGKITAVVSDNVLQKVLTEGEQPDNQFLDLVDTERIDKLQFLSLYRTNLWQSFFQKYGISITTSAKKAQMNEDELTHGDASCMVLTKEALKCREKFCEDCNKMFGLNMSVRLSECWQDSANEILDNTDEDERSEEDEQSADDTSDRPVGEGADGNKSDTRDSE